MRRVRKEIPSKVMMTTVRCRLQHSAQEGPSTFSDLPSPKKRPLELMARVYILIGQLSYVDGGYLGLVRSLVSSSHVCSRRRAIVSFTPKLWAYFDTSPIANDPTFAIVASRIQTHLERSSPVPFEVSFSSAVPHMVKVYHIGESSCLIYIVVDHLISKI